MPIDIRQQQRHLALENFTDMAGCYCQEAVGVPPVGQIAAHGIEGGGAPFALSRRIGLLLQAHGQVLMISATSSMTAKVTRYSTSETAKVRYGGTKKKSKATTLRTEAKMEGPRPNAWRQRRSPTGRS